MKNIKTTLLCIKLVISTHIIMKNHVNLNYQQLLICNVFALSDSDTKQTYCGFTYNS